MTLDRIGYEIDMSRFVKYYLANCKRGKRSKPERDIEIFLDFLEGASYRELAHRYNLSTSMIRLHCYNLAKRYVRWSEDQKRVP